jgi:hypothetical protein
MAFNIGLRTRRLVAVGCTATLALSLAIGATAESAVAATPLRPTTTNRAEAAAGWLAQRLTDKDNLRSAAAGDHLNFPPSAYGTFYWGGLTASALYAFAATRTGGSAITRIVNYMHANGASDAGIGFGSQPGPYDGSVATYALVAEITRGDATNFGGTNLLQALKDDECTAVSGPVDQNDFTTPLCVAVGSARNIYSSISESLAILAQARAGGAYAPSPAALSYFLSLQCPDGGFNGMDTSACTDSANSSPDETAFALMALQALGSSSQVVAARTAAATSWLTSHRNKAGYWAAQGAPNVDSTGLAAAALDGVWGSNAAKQKWLMTSRSWLASQQVQTGLTIGSATRDAARGAILYPYTALSFDATASEKATADAVLGMVRGGSLATLITHPRTDLKASPVLALSIHAKKKSLRAGTWQAVTVKGFAAHEKVTATLVRVINGKTVKKLTARRANAAGAVTFTVKLSAKAKDGKYRVKVRGTQPIGASATFIVKAAK